MLQVGGSSPRYQDRTAPAYSTGVSGTLARNMTNLIRRNPSCGLDIVPCLVVGSSLKGTPGFPPFPLAVGLPICPLNHCISSPPLVRLSCSVLCKPCGGCSPRPLNTQWRTKKNTRSKSPEGKRGARTPG